MKPADGDSTALLPYVPEDRKYAFATGAPLPDRAEGTALFADLSGFTGLTEALARAYGPHRGAEELTRYLEAAYGTLIREVHRYRGSVIGFSGDAITCWFGGDDGRRAVHAGIAMQRSLSSLPPARLRGRETIALGAKVAVVRGDVRRFLVGDPSVQVIDALAGRTLNRLARCEGLAERGEVVVDASLADLGGLVHDGDRIDPESDFRVWIVRALDAPDEPRPWPEVRDVDEAWARSWVLPVVQSRLRSGLDGLAADFRPSAALFLSFGGIDFDGDADAGGKLDAFVRWVQGIVTDLGGNVIQLTIGDKGAYLYCTFGAPVAHDDDAARAVSAARALRRPPQSFIEDVRIGVTHGQMYAGAYGSSTRRTYGVLGPKTNLAARLMGKAERGGMLCDEAIVRQAKRQWNFLALPPIRVKGVADPVPVFVPSAPVGPVARQDGTRGGPLFGREAEREGLRASLEGLARGEPCILLIEGEAGIGKSRLVDWLADEATSQRAVALVGNAETLEDRAPYGTWRPVLWRLLGLEDATPDERADRLAEAVADLVPDLARWSPLLGDVLGVQVEESELTRGLAPELRHRNLVHLLTQLVSSRARRSPLVIVLDEAHRLDSLSWDLAVAVAGAARDGRVPVLLALAYRPLEIADVHASALADLRAFSGARSILVGDLGSTALHDLVAAALRVPPDRVPRELTERVESRASGNPFYAEELVQALVDEGSIRVIGSGEDRAVSFAGRLGEGGSLLPGTLQGLILARVDRSPADEQLTLKVASVVGRRFRVVPLQAALDATAPVSREVVTERLEALSERALLTAETADAYLFRHVMVHEVAYGTLLFAQRRRLHKSVAEWYGREEPLPPRELNALLAHHYANAAEGSGDAGLIDLAVHYLDLTASQNEQLSAFHEAVTAYETALRLLPEEGGAGRRARLLVAAGGVHERMGAYHVARERFEAAQADPGNERNRAAALAGLCLVHTRAGEEDEARETGAEALRIAEEIGDVTLSALVRGRLGIIAALGGDFPEAETHFGRAQRHYQDSGQPQNAAAWLNNLGLVLIFQERFTDAHEKLSTALDLARTAHAQDVEAQVLMNLGLVAQRQNDLDTAAERYRASLALCRTLLARQDAVTNVVNLGDIALARGQLDEAWDAYTGGAAEAMDLGAVPKALDALRGAAEVLLVRGEDVRAAELLGLVLRHPASNVEVETEANRVLARLEERLNEEERNRALEEGAVQEIGDVVTALRPAIAGRAG